MSDKTPPAPRSNGTKIVHGRVAGMTPRQDYSGGDGGDNSPRWLKTAAGYSWRILVVGAIVYLLAVIAGMLQFVFVALFGSIVMTAVLRPLVDLLNRVMPRWIALIISFILSIAVVLGLLLFIGVSIASQAQELGQKFTEGITEIGSWLEKGPIPISGEEINDALRSARDWIFDNRSNILSQALNSAGAVAQTFVGLALAVFCAIFFIHSGKSMWGWFLEQLPRGMQSRWQIGGEAAWDTFAGYTRGIFIISATNGFFAAIALWLLQVPLALPLGLLVFIGTFIPLIGSPVAMAIATVVALAARGPIIALVSMGMIVLIGQLEGNVLQPLVMGKQVSLHPVIVAVVVAAGTVLAGVVGAIISVPVVAVIWAVYSRLRSSAEDYDPLPGEASTT